MSAGAWWVVHEENMLAMMRRCYAGEDPDIVFAEEYANCEHEHVEGNDGEN